MPLVFIDTKEKGFYSVRFWFLQGGEEGFNQGFWKGWEGWLDFAVLYHACVHPFLSLCSLYLWMHMNRATALL